MSSPGVANPVPKNTKTINDVFSSQDSGVYKESKPLDIRRRSGTKERTNGKLNSSNFESAYSDNPLGLGYNSSSGKTRIRSIAKQRTNTSVRRNIPKGVGMNSTKNSTLTITNDFDVMTVTEGLDDIDIMLDVLEKDIPEDVYEGVDFDVEEMMKANRALRDKIHDISEMVITAIQKASKLKKQIITHRDPPPDPGVNDRLKEIKNYQLKIMKCKRKIKALNIRLENLADTERISSEENKLKIIDAEIKELQRQK